MKKLSINFIISEIHIKIIFGNDDMKNDKSLLEVV